MTAAQIVALAFVHALRCYRFRSVREADIQQAIAELLVVEKITAEREHVLSARDRVDFYADGCALEVKTQGALAAVAAQLLRYAEHDDVGAIVLATTRSSHTRLPSVMLGKPVHVVLLRTGAF